MAEQHPALLNLGISLLLPLLLGVPTQPAVADDTITQPPAVAGKASTASAVADEVITLELIMSDPDWIGNSPEGPYWADDSSAVYFEQKRVGEPHRDLFRVDIASGEHTLVSDEERGIVDVSDGSLSRDRSLKIYARHGDLYLKSLDKGEITQLTRTAVEETDPRFTADGRGVIFRRGDAVLVRHLDSGLEDQPADIRLTDDPDAAKGDSAKGNAAKGDAAEENAAKENAAEEDAAKEGDTEKDDNFLAAQQLRLFDVLRREKEDKESIRDREKQEQTADSSRPPLPFFLGDKVTLVQAALAPAGRAMVLVLSDNENDPGPKDQMPAWITETGYVTSQEVRPKVGTGSGPGEHLVYLDLETGEKHRIDLSVLPGIAEDPLAALRQQAADDKGQADNEEEEADREHQEDADSDQPKPRPVAFEEQLAWSPDGRTLAVQAHSIDNKDRWLALFAPKEKVLKPIHRLSNEAWINWSYNEFGWLASRPALYFLSEESGTSQLYLYSLEDGTARRLSGGKGVVSDVALDPKETSFYYTANPDHPGIYETYRVAIDSGRIEQLTALGGRNASRLSPDGESLLVTHSSTTHPPELFLQAAQPGAVARRITQTVSDRFRSLPWVEPEIVEVPSSHHSRPIYSRFYPAQDSARRSASRPAVVFVHGAGYLQNAHQGWSGYFREFMFHTFLSQQGYAVLDMDYRASAGYGVQWRTAIYRQMGTPELEDLEDGVDWLVEKQGLDRQRIGVYGGSYGGFMTMMALFKQPDLFACGAALRPVTDWAHYNHPYTSNILNTPQVDPEAYRRSSPIELAAGLEKPLLICAPMQDDNVFFQDTVRLAQRLIELEKTDWEVAIFPVEPHGFRQPSSWLNEYRRIYKLFETYLKP